MENCKTPAIATHHARTCAGNSEACQDPEADDDRGFRPALEFEVVVDRSHPEDALSPDSEGEDLEDDREGDHDVETAENNQEQVGVGE